MILNKGAKFIEWGNNSLFGIWSLYTQKYKTVKKYKTLSLHLHEINSKWIRGLRPENLKLLEGNIGETFLTSILADFLTVTPKAQALMLTPTLLLHFPELQTSHYR